MNEREQWLLQTARAAESRYAEHVARIQNDTFGEITPEELAEMRESANPCLKCGMLADVDPVFHESRYGHAPVREVGGLTSVWSDGAWRAM